MFNLLTEDGESTFNIECHILGDETKVFKVLWEKETLSWVKTWEYPHKSHVYKWEDIKVADVEWLPNIMA